jgi:hypothetical protein
VDLDEFSQDAQPFETRMDLDEFDEGADGGEELDESLSSDGQDDDQKQESSNPAGSEDTFSSPEELLRAYKTAESRIQEKTREADEYRHILNQMGHDAGLLLRRADEEAFIREMRESFQTDPAAATAMMIKKFQEGSRQEVEARIEEAVRDQGEFRRLFEEFLSDPANSRLRPYEKELEFLIRSKGFYPNEAADLLTGIENKRDLAAKRRSAAAKEVRKRAAVESGGEINEPVDGDREFYRLMKNAKTLDEMFKVLRKAKF